MSTDAHHHEYLAAIAGLPDQTPSRRQPLHGHAVGDQLSFRLLSWGQTGWQTGRVIDTNESRGTLLIETTDDIVEVDAREWPTGEVLPF